MKNTKKEECQMLTEELEFISEEKVKRLESHPSVVKKEVLYHDPYYLVLSGYASHVRMEIRHLNRQGVFAELTREENDRISARLEILIKESDKTNRQLKTVQRPLAKLIRAEEREIKRIEEELKKKKKALRVLRSSQKVVTAAFLLQKSKTHVSR